MAEWEPKRPWSTVDYVATGLIVIGALIVLTLVVHVFTR
jgi:hypothetical protein